MAEPVKVVIRESVGGGQWSVYNDNMEFEASCREDVEEFHERIFGAWISYKSFDVVVEGVDFNTFQDTGDFVDEVWHRIELFQAFYD